MGLLLLHVHTVASGGFLQNCPDGKRSDSGQENFTGLRKSACKNVIKMSLLWYPSSRVQTGPNPSDFSGEKILSMPSFGGEVKPSVPCHSFAAR
jgi:hypothetical protein